jgi:two-component system, NarL family, nitrate/nitrite response regulator NarL
MNFSTVEQRVSDARSAVWDGTAFRAGIPPWLHATGCPGRERYVKLVICDNQRILAEALAAALSACGHQVLAVTTTVADGLGAVSGGKPDVCLLELKLGDQMGGLDAARAIHQWYPDTKVLVLSEVTDPETLSLVKSSGVAGILNKNLSVDQIAAALDVVAAGGRVLDPGLLRVRNRGTARPDPGSPLDKLSPREKEVVTRIARGESTRQMSFAMSVTAETVRTYVKNVLAKLGAHSRLQLAALASRDGLVDPAPAVDVLIPADRPNLVTRQAAAPERTVAQ